MPANHPASHTAKEEKRHSPGVQRTEGGLELLTAKVQRPPVANHAYAITRRLPVLEDR